HQQKPQAHKPQAQKYQAKKYQQKPQCSYNGQKYTANRCTAWTAPKGHTAQRNWNRGTTLPAAFRNKAYVVDFRAYPPKHAPRGYQWVRNNNNVYLVSMNTGLISQIVFNLFY